LLLYIIYKIRFETLEDFGQIEHGFNWLKIKEN